MADFREYQGIDFSSMFLVHYGVGHENGGHSGRYAWGSGDSPWQSLPFGKGSKVRPYSWAIPNSVERNVNAVLRKIKDGNITTETIHTARAEVAEKNKDFLYQLGYGTKDKPIESLNKEAQTKTVIKYTPNNRDDRTHARSIRIAEGKANVYANTGAYRAPAYMYSKDCDKYLNWSYAFADGDADWDDFPQEAYDRMTAQANNSETYFDKIAEERETADIALNGWEPDMGLTLVLQMAQAAIRIKSTLKKLKYVSAYSKLEKSDKAVKTASMRTVK